MTIETQLRDVIRRLVPQAATSATAAPLRYRPLGGLGARTFLVSEGERQWVVRLPSPATPVTVLDAATEHALAAQAAAAGLAPPVTASDSASGVLVTEYLAGARPWTPADARLPGNIARIADRLRALHRLPVALPSYEPLRMARHYLDAGGDLSDEERRWADELMALARDFEVRRLPTVPCHNDLVAANILDDGTLQLVDFEYATQAAPILDLANLAAMNDYDEAQLERLIDAYYAGTPASFGVARLTEVVRLVRLLSYFWAAACSRRAADAEPYLQLGARLAAALKTGERVEMSHDR